MVGVPAQQQRGSPPNAAQQQNMQAMMQAQDEKIARAMQAHYDHRAQHPSYHHGGGGGGHHGGGGGHHSGGHGGLGPLGGMMMMGGGGGGHSGGYSNDPEREARHKARDEQLKMAYEVNPEAFVHVPMLYVQCLLNNTPIKAFVDTGAQMTVMTVACAKACNLLNVIDSRFRGVAAGVGAARIVGRVHMATLRFGRSMAVDCSITVLDQQQGHAPDLLIGLDLMRKYQATIDLGRNGMVLGGELIPFIDDPHDKKRDERRR